MVIFLKILKIKLIKDPERREKIRIDCETPPSKPATKRQKLHDNNVAARTRSNVAQRTREAWYTFRKAADGISLKI